MSQNAENNYVPESNQLLIAELLKLAQMVEEETEKETIMSKIADILDSISVN